MIEYSSEPIERAVTLTADDRPFRIIRVTGPALSGPVEGLEGLARVHHLTLRLDPASVATSGGMAAVVIETDHPDHPQLPLSVFALPSAPSS